MLKWMEEPYATALIDAVASAGTMAEQKYNAPVLLAHYSGLVPTCQKYEDIYDRLETAEKGLAGLGEYERTYIQGIIKGIRMMTRVMSGEEISYAEQILDMQEVVSREVSSEQIEPVRERVDRKLTDRGYRGTVAEKVRSFLEDTRIDPEEVVSVTRAFLSRCKEATEKKILTLPPGDGIDSINGVRGVFWSGNSAYLGEFKGKLTFNLDKPWSLPTFGNVLCHEGYPGHHAFYCHWDDLFRQGKLPLEGSFYIKNTPTNAMFEGAPECALHFLGWDDPEEETPEITDQEKMDFALGRDIQDLQRIYQTNCCHLVNIEGMSREQAVSYMTGTGFMKEIEANNTYRFFTDPTRRTYYVSYFYGRWIVQMAYEAFPKERRGEFFDMLYNYPHTNKTLIMKVKEMTGEDISDYIKKGLMKQ